MTPEETQKAELTLVLMMDKLPTRQARKKFCKHLKVPWGEYQHLKEKYSRIIDRYKKEKEKENEMDRYKKAEA
jgi:hypothetical protein